MKNQSIHKTTIEEYRPAGNQFTLRGMFIFTTAFCIMLAILALVMKEARDWLGAMLVPLVCLGIIAILELGRLLFPPQPQFKYYLPPLPPNPLQTAFYGPQPGPIGPHKNYFGDNSGSSPFASPPIGPVADDPRPGDEETKAARGK